MNLDRQELETVAVCDLCFTILHQPDKAETGSYGRTCLRCISHERTSSECSTSIRNLK